MVCLCVCVRHYVGMIKITYLIGWDFRPTPEGSGTHQNLKDT
jgi:hypothetical protein